MVFFKQSLFNCKCKHIFTGVAPATGFLNKEELAMSEHGFVIVDKVEIWHKYYVCAFYHVN